MQWTVEKYAVKYYKLINYTAGESKISFQAQCDFLSILKTESWIKLLQRGMQIGTDQSVKCILVVCSNKALLCFIFVIWSTTNLEPWKSAVSSSDVCALAVGLLLQFSKNKYKP